MRGRDGLTVADSEQPGRGGRERGGHSAIGTPGERGEERERGGGEVERRGGKYEYSNGDKFRFTPPSTRIPPLSAGVRGR